jgi:hypothetical protein
MATLANVSELFELNGQIIEGRVTAIDSIAVDNDKDICLAASRRIAASSACAP